MTYSAEQLVTAFVNLQQCALLMSSGLILPALGTQLMSSAGYKDLLEDPDQFGLSTFLIALKYSQYGQVSRECFMCHGQGGSGEKTSHWVVLLAPR